MSANRLMATLSGLLDRTRLAEETLVAGLSADERVAAGTLERWSAKDLIAHVTAWHTNLAETLEAALAGETPPRPRVDEANARTFEENAHKSWQQVQAEAEAVLGRVQGLLAQFGDEDLLNPDRYPWRRGHALAPVVTLRLYWHPHVHLGEFYAQRGDRVPAEAVRGRPAAGRRRAGLGAAVTGVYAIHGGLHFGGARRAGGRPGGAGREPGPGARADGMVSAGSESGGGAIVA